MRSIPAGPASAGCGSQQRQDKGPGREEEWGRGKVNCEVQQEEAAPAWELASCWEASPDRMPHSSVTGYFYMVLYARVE